MRLINTETLNLETFFDANIPEFAILSHTWSGDEMTFAEMLDASSGASDDKAGYKKIVKACELSKSHGHRYIWIDTCCIDKTSSAELSEAINSMFRWYRDAVICYAYLVDVDEIEHLKNSRWFDRGWTLQELIAPREVMFYNSEWKDIGTKVELSEVIALRTKINKSVLTNHGSFSDYSVAQRMSWTAKRQTTRKEDIAYCLLGIFNIHMPLLYGEGDRAFLRLQEEILRTSQDQSLLAWSFKGQLADDGLDNYTRRGSEAAVL